MKQNIRAMEHRIYSDVVKPIRLRLAEILDEVEQTEYEKYKKTPFQCVDCKKDIDGKFVIMQSFKNMDAWFNHDLDFTDFKVFHIKCWNKHSLRTLGEVDRDEK